MPSSFKAYISNDRMRAIALLLTSSEVIIGQVDIDAFLGSIPVELSLADHH